MSLSYQFAPVDRFIQDHPKTFRLAAALGCDEAPAVGYLVVLWNRCLNFAPDGNLAGKTNADIAFFAGFKGDPDKFVDALKSTGWMDDDNALHEWDEYSGKAFSTRAKNAERARERRAEKAKTKKKPNKNASVTKRNDAYENVAGRRVASASVGKRKAASENVGNERRGEERRGEGEDNSRNVVQGRGVRGEGGSEPDPGGPGKEKSKGEFPKLDSWEAVFGFLDRKTGRPNREVWEERFPLIEIEEHAESAFGHKAWDKARDKVAYIRNWLRREHERAEDRQERKTRSQSFTRKHGQPSPDNGTGYYPPGERFTCPEGIYLLPAADTHGNKIRLRRRKPNGDQVFWDWTHQTRYQQGSIWDQNLHEQGQSPWRTAKGQGGK